MKKTKLLVASALLLSSATTIAATTCKDLPDAAALKATLMNVLAKNDYGGDGHPAWMTLVDASGTVCAVVTSINNPSRTDDVC